MIAFHVQRGISVPLSGPEFLQGLGQRFPERDGMYFLPDQVAEYDRKRTEEKAEAILDSARKRGFVDVPDDLKAKRKHKRS